MNILESKLIVIKIGSSTLIDKTENFKKDWINKLIDDVYFLIKKNIKVIIVTSGAIALGCKLLKKNKKKLKLKEYQAVAAVGQIELMNLFKKSFLRKKLKIAQILLTLEDTENRRRSLNAKDTISNLFMMNIIPIVNENDTTATTEIRYGDNDRLAARVAQITNANTLIMLSDIDGLYSKNPNQFKDSTFIEKVTEINNSIEESATKSISDYGSGGMITKIEAAKICMDAGCNMLISSGKVNNPIQHIIKNKRFTWFVPKINSFNAKKKWIMGTIKAKGSIIVDNGAANALASGKSLLPVGIVDTYGSFQRGDTVLIQDSNKNKIGLGVTSYSNEEIQKIKRLKSDQINKALGYSSRGEVIHIDNLVRDIKK
jgi:glutamate 5-kinase